MKELDFIEEFLRDNLDYVMSKYRDKAALTVSSKRDVNDLLTEVDLTIQKRAVEKIQQLFPGDGIVGEEGEYAAMPKDAKGRYWCMDPIDGTNNFVRGMFPIFGIAIAFAVDGEGVAAGILVPGLGDLYSAERGKGAWRNKRDRLRVSNVQLTAEARIDVDFSGLADRQSLLDHGARMIREAGQMRCFGSAVTSICQIAAGEADGYIHMNLSPWDFAAGQLMVEEAGGMASRLDGSPLRMFDKKAGVLITNGAIHKEMLELMA